VEFAERIIDMGILADDRRTNTPRFRLAAGKAVFAVYGAGSFGGIGAPAFR